jgi:hypothetical protein
MHWPYLASVIKISNYVINSFPDMELDRYSFLLLRSNGCNPIKAVKSSDIRIIDITNT